MYQFCAIHTADNTDGKVTGGGKIFVAGKIFALHRIKVARGPWHILSAGPLCRGLATVATSTGARETVGAKI